MSGLTIKTKDGVSRLPVELEDKIFLYLEYDDLERTREFQSEYIRHLTQFKYFADCIRYKNDECLRFLLTRKKRDLETMRSTIDVCINYNNFSAFDILMDFLKKMITTPQDFDDTLYRILKLCIDSRNSKFMRHINNFSPLMKGEMVIFKQKITASNIEFLESVLELGGKLIIAEGYALLSAVTLSAPQIVEYLVKEQFYDINFKDGYPLITSVTTKNYEMAKLLLELGANPNFSDGYALKFVKGNNLEKFEKLLRSYGADENKAVRQRTLWLNDYYGQILYES